MHSEGLHAGNGVHQWWCTKKQIAGWERQEGAIAPEFRERDSVREPELHREPPSKNWDHRRNGHCHKIMFKAELKQGPGSPSSLHLISCQCSQWPTMAGSLGRSLQGRESQMAQLRRANVMIHQAEQELPEWQDTGAGYRTKCVLRHHLYLRTTTAYVWQRTAGRFQGIARAGLHQ